MNDLERSLWEKIKAFSLDDAGAEFSFTDRLARENSWSLTYTVRVIAEYKKFIFLICAADRPLTPSDQVDQAWHLHLIYTESYWVSLCKHTLNKMIHHGPTRGGEGQRVDFTKGYEQTKELYQIKFGEQPPLDIWPASTIRFGEINFTRVNLHKNWVIPKIKLFNLWKF